MIRLYSEQINFLKFLAVILMVIDHVGMFLLPDVLELRVIGRPAFIIFNFLIIYNYINNTSNKERYIKRLLLFAIISQPFYMFAMHIAGHELDLNIFFTFSISLIFIYIIENFKGFTPFLFFIIVMYISSLVQYGTLGFLLSLAFFYYVKNIYSIIPVIIVLFFLENPVLSFYIISTNFDKLLTYDVYSYLYILSSIFSICLILMSKDININRFNFMRTKLFYWFYPVHLLILSLFK